MIGLDTNILIRYFVKDDPMQTRFAVELVHSLTPKEPGWVGQAVLLELAWVMMSTYRVGRGRLTEILEILVSTEELVVEQAETVRVALQLFRAGNTEFSDCLIAASAKAAGCRRTVTFDRRAARDTGMEWVG